MTVKHIVVQYANKRKPNGKLMTSLIEIEACEEDTIESLRLEVINAMIGQGEPCSRCFVIVK